MTVTAVKWALSSELPWWRRLQLLENANVAITEFGATEAGNAAAVLGILMGPGWLPNDQLKNRQPRNRDQLLDGWMVQP